MTKERHTLLPTRLANPAAYDRWCQACQPAYTTYLEECDTFSQEVAYRRYVTNIASATAEYHKELKGGSHDKA